MTTLHHAFRSMASDVTIDIAGPMFDVAEKVHEAIEVFASIEVSCTRFHATSPLMRANADPGNWHSLPPIAIEVIRAAYEAYQLTNGVFDPRILGDLLKSGYDENMRFEHAKSVEDISMNNHQQSGTLVTQRLGEWHPEFGSDRVLIGDLPIDLGGIGKGFAVQRAMEILQDCAAGVLINAGGDIAAEGINEDGGVWRLGVENPWNPEGDPVLVVELADASIATSSIRLRSWLNDGRPTHHLIDPTTGLPGGRGLVAVSAIAASTSIAEVWSKTLFLKGLAHIEQFADRLSVAAAWIDETGKIYTNMTFQKQMIWGVSQAPFEK